MAAYNHKKHFQQGWYITIDDEIFRGPYRTIIDCEIYGRKLLNNNPKLDGRIGATYEKGVCYEV